MQGQSHYEVLGVSREASPDAIRAAYHQRAREYHPDHNATGVSRREGDAMSSVNEAYRVLRDPDRRATYDASLHDRSAGRPAATSESGPSPHWQSAAGRPSRGEPRRARITWHWALTLAVGVVVAGIVLSMISGAPEPPAPDGVLRVGDCVEIEADLDAREVSCTGESGVDHVVEVVVDFDEPCPARSEPHRDQLGMGIACVVIAG